MIKSMTGYGKATTQRNGMNVTIEMKAVNHRFCEIIIRAPRTFMYVEDKLKQRIQKGAARGRIEVFIHIEGAALVERQLVVDWSLLDQYVAALKEAQRKYELTAPLSIEALLQSDLVAQLIETETDTRELEQQLIETLDEALAAFLAMRQTEGHHLRADLLQQLAELERHCLQVKEQAPFVSAQYRERLTKRMQEWANGVVDEQRLMTEVAVFADKADISEELIRLNSHIEQCRAALESNESVGRKLDFLVQELNRETNTIGSKANDVTISQHVVMMKSIVEKLKEQVQNVE